jgi:hypothetical protein
MVRLLQALATAEEEERWDDAEVTCEGRECWVGLRQTNWRTVNALLRLVALRDVSDTDCVRYAINDVGQLLLEQSGAEDEIRRALYSGHNFTIENGHVRRLKNPVRTAQILKRRNQRRLTSPI